MILNRKLKGLPQFELEFLEEEYDTWDRCYYVEVYNEGLRKPIDL